MHTSKYMSSQSFYTQSYKEREAISFAELFSTTCYNKKLHTSQVLSLIGSLSPAIWPSNAVDQNIFLLQRHLWISSSVAVWMLIWPAAVLESNRWTFQQFASKIKIQKVSMGHIMKVNNCSFSISMSKFCHMKFHSSPTHPLTSL